MEKGAVTNVIKSSGRSNSPVLKHRTLAAKAEAAEIIAEAKEYAAEVAEKAEKAAQRAFEKARKEGEATALREYETQVLAAIEMRHTALVQTEREILRLSIKLAEKIVGRELQNNPETVVDIVANALQHARQKQNLMIRVNPQDHAIAQQEIEKFKSFSRSNYIDIAADPRVGVGGCLIESEVGTVDARLETQFRVLRSALLSRAEGNPDDETE